MNRAAIAAVVLLLTHCAFADAARKVRIDFVEALSPKDTTSSERFQKYYEATIDLARTLLKSKLASCGYELETKTAFYEANDALQGKEIAAKVHTEGSWLIVGPRRSNHYLLLAQGAGTTPTVSLMASADDVSKLGPSHISISPTNSELASVAAKEAALRAGKGARYLSIVSDDCTACVDFSKAFDRSARAAGLKKVTEIPVHGESFDIAPLRSQALKIKPDIVLIPNYSIVAARIINAISDALPSTYFVGGDGWGDQRYGFVQSGLTSNTSRGFTVRGFPPVATGLGTFTLGRAASMARLPFSGPYVGILKILSEVADTLCTAHPTSKESFASDFRQKAASKLHAPWGVSIYDLKAGQLSFKRTVSMRR